KPSARPAPEPRSHVGTLPPAEARAEFHLKPAGGRKTTRSSHVGTLRGAAAREAFPRANAPVREGAQFHALIRGDVSLPMSVYHKYRPCRHYFCSCSKSTGSVLPFRPPPPQ